MHDPAPSVRHLHRTDRAGTVRVSRHGLGHIPNTKRVACCVQDIPDLQPDVMYEDRPWLSTPAHRHEWTRTLKTWRLLPCDTLGGGDCAMHCALDHVRSLRRYWRSKQHWLGPFPELPDTVQAWRSLIVERMNKLAHFFDTLQADNVDMLLFGTVDARDHRRHSESALQHWSRICSAPGEWMPSAAIHVLADILSEVDLPSHMLDHHGHPIKIRVFVVQNDSPTCNPMHQYMPMLPCINARVGNAAPTSTFMSAKRLTQTMGNYEWGAPLHPTCIDLVIENHQNVHWSRLEVDVCPLNSWHEVERVRFDWQSRINPPPSFGEGPSRSTRQARATNIVRPQVLCPASLDASML